MGIIKSIKRRLRPVECSPESPPEVSIPVDIESNIAQTIRNVSHYTMTSPERIAALCQAVEYTVQRDIPGAIVECGVWRGGSMMAVAETLLRLGVQDRDLYLFDTFEGMSEPESVDVDCFGQNAKTQLEAQSKEDPKSVWCVSQLDDVKHGLSLTGYPAEKIHYVVGKVEDTLPHPGLAQISLLRLDTDWYESTKCELTHLYPRLSVNGVLIIDDFGHWQGCRKAVEEYFATEAKPILLNRIDYTGRIGLKS